jgi:hypothetical protein
MFMAWLDRMFSVMFRLFMSFGVLFWWFRLVLLRFMSILLLVRLVFVLMLRFLCI